MALPRIIALSGWKGSGKDTVGKFLLQEYGYIPLSFAGKLKDMVASQYNIPREVLDDPTRKEMPLMNMPVIHSDRSTYEIISRMSGELPSGFWTPRALCILEGSTKRAVRANYWVESVITHIHQHPEQRYVITDMRYQSEMDTLRLFFPTSLECWRVNRYDMSPSTDPSERDLDTAKFDAYVSNTGTIYQAQALVDQLMAERGA